MLDLQSYLRGKGRNVPLKKGRLDLTSYMLGKAASGGIQEITGTLPLYVRSRASQILKNYIIYGESVQDGTPTPEEPVEVTGLGVRTENLLNPDENKQGNGYAPNTILTSTGIQKNDSFWVSEFISIKPNTKYWVFRNLFRATRGNSVVKFYVSATEYLSYNLIQGQLTPVEYNADNCTSFTTPSTANYLRISIDKNSSMNFIVESEECPISFIPHGYKLPMTVRTWNLAPPLREWVDGYIDVRGGIALSDPTRQEKTSPFIKIEPNTSYTYVYQTGSFPPVAWWSVGFYDESQQFISRPAGQTTFESPSNAEYCRLSFRTYGEQYNVMFTKGTTPPDHYIPYYNTETPIYIGDSQLMEGEYVDYESGKVYKRTENVMPPSDKQTIEINGMRMSTDGDGIYRFDGTTTETTVFSINLKSAFIIPSRDEKGMCYFFNSFTNVSVAFYDGTSKRDEWYMSGVNRVVDTYITMAGKWCNRMVVRIPANVTINGIIAPVMTKGVRTSNFIPYLQPTDPPIPLPDITLPQGEVIIDVDGDPKPQATIKGKIEQIT